MRRGFAGCGRGRKAKHRGQSLEMLAARSRGQRSRCGHRGGGVRNEPLTETAVSVYEPFFLGCLHVCPLINGDRSRRGLRCLADIHHVCHVSSSLIGREFLRLSPRPPDPPPSHLEGALKGDQSERLLSVLSPTVPEVEITDRLSAPAFSQAGSLVK